MINKTADLLDAGANKIDEYGHVKGVLWSSEGSMCLRGALIKASEDQGNYQNFMDRIHGRGVDDIAGCVAVADHLGLEITDALGPLNLRKANAAVRWNNAPERTAEEVTSAMRETAASLRLQSEDEPEQEVKQEPVTSSGSITFTRPMSMTTTAYAPYRYTATRYGTTSSTIAASTIAASYIV